MIKGKVKETYNILAFNDDLELVDVDEDSANIQIDQYTGETLEVWNEREDGYLFVYCNRLEIGYWVIRSHIELEEINND